MPNKTPYEKDAKIIKQNKHRHTVDTCLYILDQAYNLEKIPDVISHSRDGIIFEFIVNKKCFLIEVYHDGDIVTLERFSTKACGKLKHSKTELIFLSDIKNFLLSIDS